ncbi:MAG TPA: GAF domain-containing protein [Polyangiales bacterium]|nr:GAF domain-containing protein [Polyangiales bacterium]
MSQVRLETLVRCFEGITPCAIATADPDGTPNITYLSQVYYIDNQHVALSRQFFNKTHQNLQRNPRACLQFYDPLTFHAYEAQLRFDHSETSGVIFDAMAARIQMIATHTGMSGIFKLVAADVCELTSLERIDPFLMPGAENVRLSHVPGVMTELRGLQLISDRINRAENMDQLLSVALASLEEFFGLRNIMVLLPDESEQKLVTIASRGYGESGIGAEIAMGKGLIGTVAATRKLMRISGLAQDLRYGRAIRARVQTLGGDALLTPEIPLPGLPKAASQLALPMLVGDELIGVIVFESESSLAMRLWHESFLQVLSNQIAIGIDRLREEEDDDPAPLPSRPSLVPPGAKPRKFTFFRNDDCVFVDGEYLVRNVPGKILWKLLNEYQRAQRTQFTNRELRLDPTLGLPALKDNLESRLILLRKRLVEKCPEVKLVPTQRGRFALELECPIQLDERDHG